MAEEKLLKMVWEEKKGETKTARGHEMKWLDNDKTIILFDGVEGPVIIHKNRLVSIK